MPRLGFTLAIVIAVVGCELPRADNRDYPEYEECLAIEGESATSSPLVLILPQLQLRPGDGLVLNCPSSECLRSSRPDECWFDMDGTLRNEDGRPSGTLLLGAPETSAGCPEITGIEALSADGSDFRAALPTGTSVPSPENSWYLPCDDADGGVGPGVPLLLSFDADASAGAEGSLTIRAVAARVPEDGLRLTIRFEP